MAQAELHQHQRAGHDAERNSDAQRNLSRPQERDHDEHVQSDGANIASIGPGRLRACVTALRLRWPITTRHGTTVMGKAVREAEAKAGLFRSAKNACYMRFHRARLPRLV